MDKKKLLVLAQEDMKELISRMTYETKGSIQNDLGRYFHFIDAINELPTLEAKQEAVSSIIIEPEHIQINSEEITILPKIESYRFERKLKGGFLPEISAFVPEKKVREMELQHGDMVYAVRREEDDEASGPPHYEFDVAEYKCERQPKDRVQIDWCIVEKDSILGRLVINHTMDGEGVRIGGVLQTVLIDERDVEGMKLKEGDIVDIAYTTNQPGYIRVIWRHTIDDKGGLARSSSVKRRLDKERESRTYTQSLVGKKILMVGFEPGRTNFEDEVRKRGGDFEWSSGNEGYDRLSSMISKSDTVIMMLSHMSHNGSISAVEIAKQLEVPHGSMHTFGRSSFINKVHECLGLVDAE